MKTYVALAIASGAALTAGAAPALAQTPTETTPSYMRERVKAPRDALEIGVSTGYTQGFGDIAANQSVGRQVDAGFGLGMNLGFRASPLFSMGAAGQYQEFNPDNRLGSNASARGLTLGADGTLHIAPYERLDPFVTLGTGYRMLWTLPNGAGNDVLTHGFQLAKVNLGVDVRVNDNVAIAPMIGADLNLFVWRNPEGPRGNVEIEDKRVNTFIYGGVQGRFDVGGRRVSQSSATARR